MVNKRISFLAVLIFAFATVVAFSPARGIQEKQPSECVKTCKKAHNQCRQAPGANLAECKKAYDACLESCKTPAAEPIASPEMTPSPAPSPSPEMTPSPAPSPSPEVTPSPAPSPSPEMTPSPSPSS
jgi:hypothetical protein